MNALGAKLFYDYIYGWRVFTVTNAEEVDRLDIVSAANSSSPNGSASRRLRIAVDGTPRINSSIGDLGQLARL